MAKGTPPKGTEAMNDGEARPEKLRRQRSGRRARNEASTASTPDTFAARTDLQQGEASDRSGAETRSESMSSEPSEEDIRLRAYHRYLERGGGQGTDFDDWLEAERELKHRA
jgi:Protein of unknown function (DUF2934)